jgi:hypothetical protein
VNGKTIGVIGRFVGEWVTLVLPDGTKRMYPRRDWRLS